MDSWFLWIPTKAMFYLCAKNKWLKCAVLILYLHIIVYGDRIHNIIGHKYQGRKLKEKQRQAKIDLKEKPTNR